MTLILSLCGKKSIWMLADRRLSLGNGRIVRDDATKVLLLETPDTVSLLGYAGLGATPLGTEPSAWMSGVLRGCYFNLSDSLAVLADAMTEQFPRHLKGGNRRILLYHQVVIISYSTKDGLSRSMIRFAQDRNRYVVMPINSLSAPQWSIPFFGAGSGMKNFSTSVVNNIGILDARSRIRLNGIKKMITAAERNQLSFGAVATALARLNFEVHTNDKSVGPNCIVIWRTIPNGWGHQFFEGDKPDGIHLLPRIADGIDMKQVSNTLLRIIQPRMSEVINNPDADSAIVFSGLQEEINALMQTLPTIPDDKLV